MTLEHIAAFLKDRSVRIAKLPHRPIILKWLESGGMQELLHIIDEHVADLLPREGGPAKVEEWFLSGDRNFVTLTAERYILRYLRAHNQTLDDPLTSAGADAYLITRTGERVGIEITTLNQFVAEWVFVERLTEFARAHPSFEGKRVEVAFSFKRLNDELFRDMYGYVEAVGQALINEDSAALEDLGINWECSEAPAGYISWRVQDADTFPWLDALTNTLYSRLEKGAKARQVKAFTHSLVFVGVNQLAPNNWAFPSVFEALPRDEVSSYAPQVNALCEYWEDALTSLPNVSGICFFYYSLDRVEPFYPLKMLWPGDKQQVDIQL